MNATECLANATPEQKALYNKGMNELRQQFVSMSSIELGCDGCCNRCQHKSYCQK